MENYQRITNTVFGTGLTKFASGKKLPHDCHTIANKKTELFNWKNNDEKMVFLE